MRAQLNLSACCPPTPLPVHRSLLGSNGAGIEVPGMGFFPPFWPLLLLAWLEKRNPKGSPWPLALPAAPEREPEQGRRARKTLRWLPLMN